MRLVCKLTESHKTISRDSVAFDCNIHLLYIFQQTHAIALKASESDRHKELGEFWETKKDFAFVPFTTEKVASKTAV